MAMHLTKDSLRILVVDNYDSFTFNLVHYLEDIVQDEVTVMRVDDARAADIYSHDVIVFSPGPGLPEEFENLLILMKLSMAANKRILGVCLGHQALAMADGAQLKNMKAVHHGVSHELFITAPSALFSGLGLPLMVGRYHSWVIDEETLPASWTVTSRDSKGDIMAMEKDSGKVCGIQFHPESVLTPNGKKMLRNFLELT